MKTSELVGAALDWAVGIANGWITYPTDSVEQGRWFHTNPKLAPRGYEHNRIYVPDYSPSTDWNRGGPIIERENICLRGVAPGFHAWYHQRPPKSEGPTMLIAAMRCYVASKLGDEVEIPEEFVP